MQGKVVLVCTDRARTWRHVTPPLAGAANQLVHASGTGRAVELLDSGAVDLALVEWPSGIDLDAAIAAAGRRVPLVVIVSETGIRALEELICRRGLLHLCAARPEQEASAARVVDPGELVVTCEKILRRDLFGLDKYLAGFGIERASRTITRADERDAVVAQLSEAARALGAGRRVVESVSLVADELFTNAVYNAPRNADGRPRYAHVSRREKVALEPGEHVRIEFGSDGRTFGLSVGDRFGGLAPDALRGAIERCIARQDPIENKPGGAGIGLYAALCHADQLVFNRAAGQRTEVIALWSLTRKTGGRGAGVASLHFFDCGEIGAGRGAAAEASVELSDAVKSEIFAALVESSEARVQLTEPRVFDTVRDTVRVVKPAGPDAVTLLEVEGTPVPAPAPAAEPPPAEETGPAEANTVIDEADEGDGEVDRVDRTDRVDKLDEVDEDEAHQAEAEPRVTVTVFDRPGPVSHRATIEVDADMVLAADFEPDLDPDGEPVDSSTLTPVRDVGVVLEVESGMLVALESDDLDDDEDDYAGDHREPDAKADEAEHTTQARAMASQRGGAPGAPVGELMEDPIDHAEAVALGGAGDGDPDDDIEELDLANAIDMADLYEMATVMEATGMLPSPGPPWLGPLTCLRGVHIPRRTDGPGFESALARLRASVTLADAVELLLSYLVSRWSAAMLLCRSSDALLPWSAAGDVESWEELCELEVPLSEGWLSARSLSPGVTLGALDDDVTARRLSDLLTAQGADQGLALSFVLDQGVLVVFACRWRANAPGDSAADYEELQRELAELTARIDRFSRLPTMRRQSARARVGGW